MFKIPPLRSFALLLVLLVASVQLTSAKVAKFTPYAGTYTGNLKVKATFETFNVPIKIVFTPTRHGRTATILVTGEAEGQKIKTHFIFGKNGKDTVTGLLSAKDPRVARGKYTFKRKKITSKVVLKGVKNGPGKTTVTLNLKFSKTGFRMTADLVEPIDPTTTQTGTIVITATKKK